MNCFTNYIKAGIIAILLLLSIKSNAQKINVDSLLTVIINDMKTEKNYQKNIQRALIGKKIAPNYLDYYLVLGKNHEMLQQKDSAIYYYSYVIDKNSKYEDAHLYLINLHLENKNYDAASIAIEKAIVTYPDQKRYYLKKAELLELQKEEKKEYEYLKLLQKKYPDENAIQQRIIILESKFYSDRIGINYTITAFNRDNVGPWHLGGLEYIRQRSWGSLIGRINYANRFNSGISVAEGVQYEAESFFFTGKKSYSNVAFAYSSNPVFPKWRLGYSYFYNFKKGWEADLGFRYIKAENIDFETAVIGIGKYVGAYWINFRTFIQRENKDIYPAFTLTTRYYFDSRFDYFQAIAGYGTSPDERPTLGQFEQRIALDSYRVGVGYFKIFNKNYVTGFQTLFNNQEYAPGLKQNEFEFSVLLQYKF